MYNPKKTGNGQLLHAARLAFVHPRTNVWLEFMEPPPEKMQKELC